MTTDHAANVILAQLVEAKSLMSQALDLLDAIGVPCEGEVHLDLAIHCIADQISLLATLAL